MATLAAEQVEDLGPLEMFEPVCLGPVWSRHADGSFIFPQHTLGWEVMKFCARELRSATGDSGGWRFTSEQARFILWFYAIDDRGRWLFRDAVMQRVKGWGKDPLAAVIAAVELIGPCRFGGWLPDGSPRVITQSREPWIQVVATAKDQTKNTMSFLQGLFPDATKKKYRMEVNKEIIYAHSGSGRIEAVTSAPRTLEGNRPSLVIGNEPHHWVKSNDGHELYAVCRRNVNKMRKPKGSRTLLISNAYNPAEDSVMQRVREAYEKNVANGVRNKLYDSVEAPETVPLFPDYTEIDERGHRIKRMVDGTMVPPERETLIEHLRVILAVLGGDATWLDPEATADEILEPDSDLSEMRRFYLNSVVSGDEMYLADGDIVATIDEQAKVLRDGYRGTDILRLTWSLVGPKDPIVMFFDGSKADDSTALVGCRVSDGFTFVIGVWEKPPKSRGGASWTAPRAEIDARVHEAFREFKIVAFWADPSHAKDDESGSRYWDTLIDGWHQAYGERLQLPAAVTGPRASKVMWDMTDPSHQKTFSEAVVRTADEFDMREVVWDGHPTMRIHLRNARRAMTPAGLSIRKPGRGSARKIDLAVCFVGARMLRRLMQNKGIEQTSEKDVWIPSRRSW